MAQGADDPLCVVLTAADQTALQNKRLKTRNDAYCKARKRMVESEVKSLFQLLGQRLDKASPKAWLWHDRRVVLTDGSTLSMPDSQDNQAVYPQPSTPKKRTRFSDPENLGSDHTGERRVSAIGLWHSSTGDEL